MQKSASRRSKAALNVSFALLLATLSLAVSACVGGSDGGLEDPTFFPTETTLPVLTINTTDAAPVVSKDEYITGHVTLKAGLAADAPVLHEADTEIKGRGNTTWDMPKKPYRLKLAAKQALLGMPAGKDWALLANYADRSLLRGAMAFDLSERLGLAWTPRSQFVELVMNGAYLGTYQLTEHVKIAADRVNVREMKATDLTGEKLTGGYLVELNFRLDEAYNFTTTRGVPFSIKSDVVDAQFEYIKGYIQETEDAIFAPNFADPIDGYAKYLDVDSLIGWYLVNELFKNVDAKWGASIYFYKDMNGKLAMGPVWDFDRAVGNDGRTAEATGFHVRGASWIKRLFEDPAFDARVRARWASLQGAQMAGFLGKIDTLESHLRMAAENNFARWLILDREVHPSPYVPFTYENEVQFVRDWLSERITWLNGQFAP